MAVRDRVLVAPRRRSPPEQPAPLPWRAIVRYAALGALAMGGWVLLAVALGSGNPLDFVQPAAAGPAVEAIRADFPESNLPAGVGLDGQQFYAMARDPVPPRASAPYLDRPRYRWQRPLFPLLAWTLHPTGGGTGLIAAFVVVGVAALFIGGLSVGVLSCTLGGSPAVAALFAMTPGAYWSLRVTVADALAAALAFAAIALSARGHHRRAVGVAVAAVLAKEVALVVFAGWFVSRRSRSRALLVAIPLAVVVTWALALRGLLPGHEAGITELGLPFVGLGHAATQLWVHQRELWGAAATIAALGAAAGSLATRGRRHPLAGVIVIQLGFVSLMNASVVGLNFGGTRSTMTLLVAGLVALCTPRAANP